MRRAIQFFCSLIVLCSAVSMCCGCSETASSEYESAAAEVTTVAVTKDSIKPRYGTLTRFSTSGTASAEEESCLSVTFEIPITENPAGDGNVVQNYFNLADMIQYQGCSAFDRIEYMAMADLGNGQVINVFSCVLQGEAIAGIANGTISAMSIGSYLEDVFIHGNLPR